MLYNSFAGQQNLIGMLDLEKECITTSLSRSVFFVPHTQNTYTTRRHTHLTHLNNAITMDDMYQYASAAVNSNTPNNTNQQQGTEDNDIVLQAFNNFGWGQRFNSLLDTVKKQVSCFIGHRDQIGSYKQE